MDKNILKRLKRLENRPERWIPRLYVEYTDGHKETVMGYNIITQYKGVRRVTYDGNHQPSVEVASLYAMLCGRGVEFVPVRA